MNDDIDVAFFSEMFPPCLDSSSSAPVLSKLQASATVANEPKKRRRMRKESSKKRKLMEEQAELLERSFVLDPKLDSERKDRLAAELGLDPNKVAVWFQNRRVRWKTKKLQDEFSILRSQYDAVRLHNCRLESQVLKLKEELNAAKKEVEKLLSTEMLMRCKNSTPTPSSSLTIDTNAPAVDPALLLHMHAGDFDFHATADFHFEDHIPAFGFDLWS